MSKTLSPEAQAALTLLEKEGYKLSPQKKKTSKKVSEIKAALEYLANRNIDVFPTEKHYAIAFADDFLTQSGIKALAKKIRIAELSELPFAVDRRYCLCNNSVELYFDKIKYQNDNLPDDFRDEIAFQAYAITIRKHYQFYNKLLEIDIQPSYLRAYQRFCSYQLDTYWSPRKGYNDTSKVFTIKYECLAEDSSSSNIKYSTNIFQNNSLVRSLEGLISLERLSNLEIFS